MDAQLGDAYTSPSQKARVVTEAWAEANLYCCNCESDELRGHRANRAVEDLLCDGCDTRYQLKAKRGHIGRKVANSAWGPKIEAIRANRAPNYIFLGYSPQAWTVSNCFVVPAEFVTEPVIEQRPPLRRHARRAGWVGSNILLSAIPPQGRIGMVNNGTVVESRGVRRMFGHARRLRELGSDARGWLGEILWCIDALGKRPGDQLALAELYGFEETLRTRHPHNNHIKAKLRQQMQVAIRTGYVSRVAPGRYEVIPRG